jgi:signal peptidase II
MSKLNASNGLAWIWLSIGLLVLDIGTKLIAMTHLTLHERVPVLPMLNWQLVYNDGAAFSMLSTAGGWQRWFLSGVAIAVSIVIIMWLKRTHDATWVQKLGLACILGGALGNLADRVRFGYVIDFIDFHTNSWHFPAFNIADSAISLGAILLLFTLWRKEKDENLTG